jgi:uncharacterized C2H2 Zn-finger protein
MNLDLSSKPVKCPACGEIYYQTTDLYNPKAILTGEMLEWIPRYGEQGLNWSLCFADSDLSESICCEGCQSPIAPTGYLGLDRLVFDQAGEAGGQPVDDLGQGQNVPAEVESGLKEEIEAPEPETKELLDDDPLAKALTLKSCPECGGFYNLSEWGNHLASHPKEVRDRIEAKPEPVAEKPKEPEKPAKKGKEKWKKPEPVSLNCPMCDQAFEKQWMFDDHIKTHDMGKVQAVAK